MRFEEYTTRFVQQTGKKEGPISPVMVNSASFGYGDSETGEGIFDGVITSYSIHYTKLYEKIPSPVSLSPYPKEAELTITGLIGPSFFPVCWTKRVRNNFV